MQRVIVTVQQLGEQGVRDLEVPAEIEAERLANGIAEALLWPTAHQGQPLQYRIEAQPLGRTLEPSETLARAGVWDGAWLVLYPTSAISPSQAQDLSSAVNPELPVGPVEQPAPEQVLLPDYSLSASPDAYPPQRPPDSPPVARAAEVLKGWTSLGIELPSRDAVQAGEAAEEKLPSPFSWKQLDD